VRPESPLPVLLQCSTDLTFRWPGRCLERTVESSASSPHAPGAPLTGDANPA